MRPTLYIIMLALLAAPIAAAQDDADDTKDDTPERPDHAAWIEDCPPDMMCAAGDPQPYGDEGCIECSGPVDDGGAEPGRLGPDDCIECMRPPANEGTCMDGQQENETCRPQRDCVASGSSADACGDDVQYLDGGAPEPTRGPADGSCEYCRGDEVQPDAESHAPVVEGAPAAVPAPAVALGILALAGVALLALPRRR
jgi:hypothetical protein